MFNFYHSRYFKKCFLQGKHIYFTAAFSILLRDPNFSRFPQASGVEGCPCERREKEVEAAGPRLFTGAEIPVAAH